MRTTITRRRFLKQAAFAAGAISLSARSWSQVPGANQDVRVAVIGFNGRGKEHIKEWRKLAGVRLTALCDVDRAVLDASVKHCAENGLTVAAYTDIRKLLEAKNVDAISIATPNHWHALAAVWGMQSGRDVYVEKPVSYDFWEGEQLIAAALRNGKIVQAGTQSRSSQGIQEAVEWVNNGALGNIVAARGICYKRRPSIGTTEGPQPVPATVDCDLWCGPAPLTPPRRAKFHYDWHWFWDYGAGDLGNQGVHEVDVARWFLGEKTVSYRAFSVGGRLGYTDDGQTPNTLITIHDFKRAPLIMEVRGLPEKTGSTKMDNYKGAEIGVVIECEGGHVLVPNYTSAKAFDKSGKEIKSFEGATNHFENFIQAVRNRRDSDLHAPIEEGHLSAALCHISNISYRLGRAQPPGEMREQIQGDKDALPAFERMAEHLAANGVDLQKTQVTLGAVLRINPATAKFIQNKNANRLLRRAPRTGYVIKVA
ncbi:MAG: Gfo/Idh/MocA family oxidoreductase [Verrucomicrobiota bacterium]|jgi:predicted dehydrogenase